MKTILFFIGYERSRHSLLGALLDAHPHMVVSDESMAFGKWRSNQNKWINSSIYSFYDRMVQTSQRDVAKGKRSQVFEGSVANATSRFKYFVPNQWQGSYDQYIEVRTTGCVTFAMIKGYLMGISCIRRYVCLGNILFQFDFTKHFYRIFAYNIYFINNAIQCLNKLENYQI